MFTILKIDNVRCSKIDCHCDRLLTSTNNLCLELKLDKYCLSCKPQLHYISVVQGMSKLHMSVSLTSVHQVLKMIFQGQLYSELIITDLLHYQGQLLKELARNRNMLSLLVSHTMYRNLHRYFIDLLTSHMIQYFSGYDSRFPRKRP